MGVLFGNINIAESNKRTLTDLKNGNVLDLKDPGNDKWNDIFLIHYY